MQSLNYAAFISIYFTLTITVENIINKNKTIVDYHPLLSDPLFNPATLLDSAARIIQSNQCTIEERQKRIQCFDVLPDEKYSVPLGNTIQMKCIILNQYGKVQWRAKKILLGKLNVYKILFIYMFNCVVVYLLLLCF